MLYIVFTPYGAHISFYYRFTLSLVPIFQMDSMRYKMDEADMVEYWIYPTGILLHVSESVTQISYHIFYKNG